MPDFEVIMRNSLVRTSKGPIFHATGQELHLLNTTFTFLIFQARKMGKRRPGVAEDLMSSTADEWKAMLAAPEVFNFVNF